MSAEPQAVPRRDAGEFFTLDGSTQDLLEVDGYIRSCLNWDYGHRDGRLWSLYEKSKTLQWNATTDIDWSYDVKFGAPLLPEHSAGVTPFAEAPDSPVPPELWDTFRWEYQAWMVSQFLHGEQGALLATARLVETVPDMEAKTYAAAQVADEARHVEAYARYIDEKLGRCYPINRGLKSLLVELLAEPRWDIVYLGMQVIVEGLALAAFRVASNGFGDPIITQITRMIARDEARHVSFGVIALNGLYDQMTSKEMTEREDFLMEAIHLMSQRFMLREIWEHMGLDADKGVRFARTDPMMIGFRQLLFLKVVQTLRQIGLLTPGSRTCSWPSSSPGPARSRPPRSAHPACRRAAGTRDQRRREGHVTGQDAAGDALLDWNESPIGPPESAVRRIMQNAHTLHRYPRGLMEQVAGIAAAHFGVAPGQILLTSGVDEAIDIVLSLDPDLRARGVKPGFDAYEERALAVGRTFVPIPLGADWQPVARAEWPEQIGPRDLVFIAQPNNPTGNLMDEQFVAHAREQAAYVFLDETYEEFSSKDSVLRGGIDPGLLVYRSFSKAMGLAGIRVGCLIGAEETIARLEPLRRFMPIDAVSLHAAAAVLQDPDFVKQLTEHVLTARADLLALLRGSPLFAEVRESETNFLLARPVPAARDAILAALAEDRVRVKACEPFGLDGWFRISVGSWDDQRRLAESLARVEAP